MQINGSSSVAGTPLSIFVSDDGTLDMGSWQLWYNGADVSSWIGGAGVVDDPGGMHTSVSASGLFTLTQGTFWLKSRICDTGTGSSCTADSVQVTYSPPPPPPARARPVVTLAQRNDFRSLDGCATCASATTAYSTPAFFANGTALSTTLRYSSESAKPTGYVEVDVKVSATTVPDRLRIRLRRADGSFVTLSNTSTEAFVLGDTAAVRLAAQYDASGYWPGVYTYDVLVTAFYGSADSTTTLSGVRVLKQNESASPYGRGWAVVGDERLYRQADGSLLLTDGAGGLSYFAAGSCGGTPWTCSYAAPAGDFSTMVRRIRPLATDTIWVRTDREGGTTEWNNAGLLTSHTDRWANVSRIERMSTGDGTRIYRVKYETDVGGTAVTKYTTFAYNSTSGKLSSITLPDGRQSTFTVASGTNGELTGIVDPDGVTALAASYSAGALVGIAGRDTATTTIVYDSLTQVAKHISPSAKIEGDTIARDTTVIVSQRSVLLYSQAKALTDGARAANRVDSVFLRVTNAKGTATTTWGHVSGGPTQVLTRSSANKRDSTLFTYNGYHQTTSVTPSGQGGTEYGWWGALLLSELDVASGSLVQYEYTTFDQLDSVRVNGKTQAKYFYSGSRLAPDSVRTDSIKVTRFTYDSRGRALTVKDAANATVTTTYETTHANAASVARTASGVATSTRSTTYDGSGRPQIVTDPLGRVFKTYRDALNRDTLQIAPDTAVKTRHRYADVAGTDTVIDANTQKYTTVRNARGWVVRSVDPRGKADSVRYDRLGRPTRLYGRRGDLVTLAYDGLDRPTVRTDSAPGGTKNTTTFAYDPKEKWVAVENAESTDTLWVDHAGRPTLTTTVRAGRIFRLGYGYTAGSLTDQITVRRDSASSIVWADTINVGYNAARRAFQFMDFGNKTTTMLVDAAGREITDSLPTSTTPASKVRKSIGYSAASQVLSETYSGNPNSALSRTYGDYDAVDRIGSIARAGSPAPVVRLHEYDALGRLQRYRDEQTWSWTEYFQTPNDPYGDCPGCFILDSIVHVEVDTLNAAVYSYDKVGNRTDLGATISDGNRMTGMDGWTITYDDAGYMIKRKKGTDSLTYAWNALGQLVQVTSSVPSNTVTYGYDGLGRRVRKTVNGTATRYLVEGDRVLVELDNSWLPAAKYSYYPGVDRPHAMVRAGKRYYFAQDLQGNITGVMDSIGNVQQAYLYTPYGEALPDGGTPVPDPYRFKGREWDAEARLYFMRVRYYDPQLGRFISEDPIGLAGGINPTAFVGSEPVNRADPTGRMCQLVGWTTTEIGGLTFATPIYDGTTCELDSGGGVSNWTSGGDLSCYFWGPFLVCTGSPVGGGMSATSALAPGDTRVLARALEVAWEDASAYMEQRRNSIMGAVLYGFMTLSSFLHSSFPKGPCQSGTVSTPALPVVPSPSLDDDSLEVKSEPMPPCNPAARGYRP
ncbi:MAG: RHS repeat-associated core domain-containing protein [Gemmatimonadetes bacterium]|nr:RHS repeat-associated core domain-containing protein [Gemmatimonadota bacterium]